MPFDPLRPYVDVCLDFSRLTTRSGIATSQVRCVFNSVRIARQFSKMIVPIYTPKGDVREFQLLDIPVNLVIFLVTVVFFDAERG